MRLAPACLALLLIPLLAACGGEDAPEAGPQADTGEAPAAEAPAEAAAAEEPAMPTGDFRVVAVELGTELDEQGRVRRPRDVFGTGDTLHAAVVGVGSSQGLNLSARWLTPDGVQIARAGQSLAPEAPTVTTFSISQPTPWPTGAYRVEVAINERVVETRNFRIE